VTRFYLGTHEASWLARLDVPLFVSHRRLAPRRTLPEARTGWALDSGGFTELSMHGRWVTEPAAYVDACRRYMAEVGQLEWAAPMDWMCEPFMVEKTGLSVDRHQALTVENLQLLRQLAPDAPFIPVLQGYALADYVACIDRYASAGVDLTAESVVGVGSVCRRQDTGEICAIFRELHSAGIRCHGFGVKTLGLGRYARYLTSADSMAWSYNARRNPPLPTCAHGKHGTGSCANCPIWALLWREHALERIAAHERIALYQPSFWEAA
jgi:hypothetical protein